MKKVTIAIFLLSAIWGKAQLAVTTTSFPQETDAGVVITLDAAKGNQGLKDYDPTDVYIHLGCITNFSTAPSDWKYVNFTWATTDPNAKLVGIGNNKFTYTLTGTDMRAFFGISNPAEHILKLSMVFRNGNGSKVQRNTNASDIYLPVYDGSFQAKIIDPFRQPTYVPVTEPITKFVGNNISIEAKSSQAGNLKLFLNGLQVAALNGTDITASPMITTAGSQRIISEAELAGNYRRDTIDFNVVNATVIQDLPVGVVDGINYDANGTSVTLVLFAPNKSGAYVLGDFNSWTQNNTYQMRQTPDGQRLWLRIDGLVSGTEYGYQYLIDGSIKVADFNTEKVLDPNNDQYISNATYPGLKPYPTGLTTGLVSVLQTNKPAYTWANNSFARPEKKSMVIYEILLRDFVANHNWSTLTDTLNYLQKLGVNAVHLMPFNEFEGNSSWGYNPNFYFAADKYYGPENDLRRFIDSAHGRGIAVIMDMVLNHAGSGGDYHQVPMAEMYWAGSNPAANSPWFNVTAPHTWLSFGYDFNQDAQPYKDFTDRVITYWLTKYKIDGLRWDFTKGFSQRPASSDAASQAYDASRIAILKRIYDKMQAVSNGSYCILEHFCANTEEMELANYGMLLWGNLNYNYNEASMGYVGTSNFQGVVPTQRGWTTPNLVGYAESHDEERLNFKNINYGNSNNSPAYDVKNLATALKRQEMVASFLIPVPGPKLIWQFGELGYDFSINRCENTTISNTCRTDPKPIVWNYLQDANRLALHDVYAKLNKLKTFPPYTGTFTGNDVTYDLGGSVKWIKINGAALKVLILGNFDVYPQSALVSFQDAGTWYSYLTGTTRVATGAAELISLQPGEYYVYTNTDAQQALPLGILSFSGIRSSAAVDLTWTTANEVNVKSFDVERSYNGRDFTVAGTVISHSGSGSSVTHYSYSDIDVMVRKASATIYYRLKSFDKDGSFSYSNIVAIAPVTGGGIAIYPNPVEGGLLYIRTSFETALAGMEIAIADISGRVLKKQTIPPASSGNTIIPINVKGLSAGNYLLRATTGKNTVSKIFAIQH
ncbi:MAG: alpha-amylase family glycosyl hydrolase [Chitinophagaceae bacterium]